MLAGIAEELGEMADHAAGNMAGVAEPREEEEEVMDEEEPDIGVTGTDLPTSGHAGHQ